MIPSVGQTLAVSSKLTNQADNSIDDFVPNETIDSEFLEEAEKGVDKKSVGSKDGNEDSER